MPLFRAATDERWIAWIAPPYLPYAPALADAGLPLHRLLLNSGKLALYTRRAATALRDIRKDYQGQTVDYDIFNTYAAQVYEQTGDGFGSEWAYYGNLKCEEPSVNSVIKLPVVR